MEPGKIDVLVSAWKMYQNLAKGLGDNCWKIRTAGIGFWATIIGYGYKNNDNIVYGFSLIILFMFFILEAGTKRIQYKYIEKSIAIEKSINDFLVGEEEILLPNDGITTSIDIPNVKDFVNLFKIRRILFWFPYVMLTVITLVIVHFL
ncbi:MAG: hypothetical protein N4A62_19590 [Marinisporobacter sp.]|jgi:hypothetical protein|nr:hypothetical protein [Marinisporobacter sp.]